MEKIGYFSKITSIQFIGTQLKKKSNKMPAYHQTIYNCIESSEFPLSNFHPISHNNPTIHYRKAYQNPLNPHRKTID